MFCLAILITVATAGPLDQAWQDLSRDPGPMAQNGDFGGKKCLAPPPPAQIESLTAAGPSLGLALLQSALLPGLGENYLDRTDRAAPFWLAEGILWSSFIGFELYGGWSKTDYLDFAGQAGAHVAGKPEAFFQAMMVYQSRDEYNLNAPYLSRTTDKSFPETDNWNWRWTSAQEQHTFVTLRNRSDKAYRGASTVVSLLVVNRLLSLLDTAVLYRTRSSPHGFGLKLDGDLEHVQLTMTKDF